ncbi:NADPH-dependent F420 reductase [Nonomuraea diastatica]|uniref:NADP oxidoreductase n=1 Tax=Nonomuraea diastatica TaxID=1848329 RepID=A0A4R4WDW0_9ACTN|nr:NAD(P)-binding domain-containing protein [Nonomuraea diastatica]TDD17119.1 NADP oxidoreductase [Nonomuraea diastatica]
MRIGILGAGGMADALGTQWARAGHAVMISGRDPGRSTARARKMRAQAGRTPAAEAAAAEASFAGTVAGRVAEVSGGEAFAGASADLSTGQRPAAEGSAGSAGGAVVAGEAEVRAGTWAEAARFGEVVMVAVREAGLVDVLQAAGASMRGKPVIDVTNAAFPDLYDPTRPIARLIRDLTAGHVVKAFNLCHVDVWRMTPPVFGGRPLAVPLCGDDPAAMDAARTLVADLGCTPLNGGGLDRAMHLEATAAFVIGLWFGGADAQAILPPLASSGTHGQG